MQVVTKCLHFVMSYMKQNKERSDEGLTLETSALYSLRWPIYIFNLVDITKLPYYPHRRSTTVSLETFTLYTFAGSLFHSIRIKIDVLCHLTLPTSLKMTPSSSIFG